MPNLVKLSWPANQSSGLPLSARRGCDYEAYVPDPLVGRAVVLSGRATSEVAAAERAVQLLNREGRGLTDSETVARLLLRAESVASSKIEGLAIGGRRLLKAQLAEALGDEPSDQRAVEVVGNIEAMRWAVDTVSQVESIGVDDLLTIHERLLRNTSLHEHAGKLRDQQNWIGGSDYNPCGAAFVPPPPEVVEELLLDLCEFCADDSLPAIVQAALAHAQFETIHPFIDGNGRTGRALIHVIFRRRGLAPRVVPPISMVLATWSQDYVNALNETRYRTVSDSPAAQEAVEGWIELFAAASNRAVSGANLYENKVEDIQAKWRSQMGDIRAGSAADLLIATLPGAPLITVKTAAALIKRSEQAVNEAIPKLIAASVLKQTTVGRRNRAFEAPDLINAFTHLEQTLSLPGREGRRS